MIVVLLILMTMMLWYRMMLHISGGACAVSKLDKNVSGNQI